MTSSRGVLTHHELLPLAFITFLSRFFGDITFLSEKYYFLSNSQIEPMC
jgi:hypothetical protein